ncbi:MAG: tRNA threonylcarbamoyl adenosine modification protein YjeE [Alphaproteobacteria bacterium]|jgi:tRNA threonylcarbamoyl adenosine modification protein YjeE
MSVISCFYTTNLIEFWRNSRECNVKNKVVLTLKGEAETLIFAKNVARYAVAGDFIRLDGTLGMGKTTFARQFIRSLANNDTLSVPSPTFNLVQTYNETRLPVAHVDAYRMEDPSELDMLDLGAYFEHGVVLMEWATNVENGLPEIIPPKRHVMETEIGDLLTITIEEDGFDARTVTLEAKGTWLKRFGLFAGVMRTQEAKGREAFMDSLGFEQAQLTATSPDCSFRTYYRTNIDGEKLIVMDAPPPVEEIEPFIYMTNYLQLKGVHAPAIHGLDVKSGYMLLEDLGAMPFSEICKDEQHQEKWLEKAVDLLAHIANGETADVWTYDSHTAWLEAQRYTDWYLPSITGKATDVSDREAFKQSWLMAWPTLSKLPKTTCHWDYHVDNLMAIEDTDAGETGFYDVGVIDYQDARVGPICMDIACLLEDRFPASETLKGQLIDRFLSKLDVSVNKDDFMAGYNLCVAHRFFKITGLLVRLEQRDARVGATARMPQVWQTLNKALEHEACAGIRKVLEKIAPQKKAA